MARATFHFGLVTTHSSVEDRQYSPFFTRCIDLCRGLHLIATVGSDQSSESVLVCAFYSQKSFILIMVWFSFVDGFEKQPRHLQQIQDDSQGRAILTVLYLVVLCLCFIIPVFYCLRMHYEDRQLRRMREVELAAAIEVSMLSEQQDQANSEEARAARKKYRDEKRARILALFRPVQTTLSSDHFKELPRVDAIDPEEGSSPASVDSEEESQSLQDESYYREQTKFVEVPEQGMRATLNMRLVPNLCAICLSDYEVGEAIVWSSNLSCEHAFHTDCMESWLMKQRGAPLCPCCRQDFVVDPLDENEQYDPETEFFV